MKTENVYSYRYNFVVGGLSFAILLLLSIVFFKERVGLTDTAFHLFTILNTDNFAIQNNRFVAVLTQVFPLIGGKLNLSLTHVAQLYSASFVIVQLAIFFIINYWFKNARIALAYLFFVTIMTAHTFFWVQSELPQGVAFLFIYFAVLQQSIIKEKIGMMQIHFLLILIITIVFSHPLLLFPFIFFHAFLYGKNRRTNFILIIATVVYACVALIRLIVFNMHYEHSSFSGLKNFVTLFPDYFTIQANINFLRSIVTDYYFLVILLVANVVYYLRQKQFYKLIILLAFFIGFVGLVNVCYPDGINQFYIENQYLLLGIIVIIPFLFDVMPTLLPHHQYVFYALPIVIVVACFFRIAQTKTDYTAMLDWKRRAIENMSGMKDKRVIIKITHVPKNAFTDTWSAAYEFWFLSTLEYGYSQSALIQEKPTTYDWTWDKYNNFISDVEVLDYKDLNAPYFIYAQSTALEHYKP